MLVASQKHSELSYQKRVSHNVSYYVAGYRDDLTRVREFDLKELEWSARIISVINVSKLKTERRC